jgi:hypothetical protein
VTAGRLFVFLAKRDIFPNFVLRCSPPRIDSFLAPVYRNFYVFPKGIRLDP